MEDLERRYGQVRLASWTRMLENTGVAERPWSASLEENVARAGVGVRSQAAYEASRDRAVRAAQDVLEQAELTPWDVDVLITTHTTSWTIPGLDVDLVGRLELRPNVQRIGLATAACVGGGHGLVHAARALRDRPGGRALVVAAKDLSTLYRPGRELPTMQDVLYGGLFGDAAGAVVVSAVDEADAGDLVVEDVWELVLPESSDAYWGVVHEAPRKVTSPSAYTQPLKTTTPPVNVARTKDTTQPLNVALLKFTSPPVNVAPLKSIVPSTVTPVRSRSQPCQDRWVPRGRR